MISAIQRLILISVITVFVTFLAVFFVRWAGLKQTFGEPSHPWFQMAEWRVLPVKSALVCTSPEKIADEGISWVKLSYHTEVWSLPACVGTSISDRIARSPQKNWILEIDSLDGKPLDSLIGLLSPMDKTKNFAIFSKSQRTARYLRKNAPQWLFAADSAALVRFHMFASLWVETALEFWPDFVVQIPDDKNSQFSPRELQELERRKKRVILLPSRPE